MDILLWLVPALVATSIAMLWAGMAGRVDVEASNRRPTPGDPAYDRFVAAMERPHPGATLPRPAVRVDPRSGVAVRPSRRALLDVVEEESD